MTQENQSENQKEKKKNPLLNLLVFVITGMAIFLFVQQLKIQDLANKVSPSTPNVKVGNDQSPYYPKAKESFSIVEYPFGDFTVNLSRPSGPQRFLKVEMVFLMETPTNDKLREIINNQPTLRDEVINIFNNTSPKDILKLEGREVIKDILQKHINHKLQTDKVRRILFTRFLVS